MRGERHLSLLWQSTSEEKLDQTKEVRECVCWKTHIQWFINTKSHPIAFWESNALALSKNWRLVLNHKHSRWGRSAARTSAGLRLCLLPLFAYRCHLCCNFFSSTPKSKKLKWSKCSLHHSLESTGWLKVVYTLEVKMCTSNVCKKLHHVFPYIWLWSGWFSVSGG